MTMVLLLLCPLSPTLGHNQNNETFFYPDNNKQPKYDLILSTTMARPKSKRSTRDRFVPKMTFKMWIRYSHNRGRRNFSLLLLRSSLTVTKVELLYCCRSRCCFQRLHFPCQQLPPPSYPNFILNDFIYGAYASNHFGVISVVGKI